MSIYPVLPQSDHVDDFHGIPVADPFRWMDDAAGEAFLHNWLNQQRLLCDSVLEQNQYRQLVADLLKQMPPHVPDRLPQVRAGRAFYFTWCEELAGLALACRAEDEEKILLAPGVGGLDINCRLYADFFYVSPSGSYIAFACTSQASDTQAIRIFDVDKQRLLSDVTPPTMQPTVAWLADETGYFYNISQLAWTSDLPCNGVYFHRLGDACGNDRLVFDYSAGKGHAALPCCIQGETRLLIKTIDFVTQKAGLLLIDSDNPAKRLTLLDDVEAYANLIGLEGGQLLLEVAFAEQMTEVISVDLDSPERENWRTLVVGGDYPIARTSHAVMAQKIALCGGKLYVTHLKDVSHVVHQYDLTGTDERQVQLPEYCSVLDMVTDQHSNQLNLLVSSFLTPASYYRYDSATQNLALTHQVCAGLDDADFEVSQRFYESHDGTRVPLYLVRSTKADTWQDSPVLLYGYGGWGQSILPEFRADLCPWIGLGGTYAIANIRGGGEYGSAWHEAGKGLSKQNCFEDFCYAARYLRAEGIAAPGKLAIRGLSNGGLLVTACVNQCPELFDAAVAEIPLVDVLHLMDLPVGPAISAEYGNPQQSREYLDYMARYSPLQNISKHEKRPAVLVVVGTRDERAPPVSAYKYVAAMQASVCPGQVVLLRLAEGEGHTGWRWQTLCDVLADELGFLWGCLAA